MKVDHGISILYGSGEQPSSSDYKFFNTFGNFAGKFDQRRLEVLDKIADSPIDMRFMENLPHDVIMEIQSKCPQARYLLNDKRSFEITLKLVIIFIKLSSQNGDKNKMIEALKFLMEQFLLVDNFDLIESESEAIEPLGSEMVDVLLNSAVYYQKKYEGEL